MSNLKNMIKEKALQDLKEHRYFCEYISDVNGDILHTRYLTIDAFICFS